MRLLLLSLLMLLMVVSPARAQLELDEEGCQTWVPNIAELWQAVVAHPESIGESTGFWTLDAQEGEEYLLVRFDFEQTHVVTHVELVWVTWTPFDANDRLELQLPFGDAVAGLHPLGDYTVGSVDETFIWDGKRAADSIGVYMRADTDDDFRGILKDATVCIAQPPDVENALWLLIETAIEPLSWTVALFVGFLVAAALLGAGLSALS